MDLSYRLRSGVRSLRPHAGALANARDAVRHAEQGAAERHDAVLQHARARGTTSWQVLHRTPVPARRGAGHAVHFAADDADLVSRLTAYVAEGLGAGELCIVIATAGHRAGLRQSLAINGLQEVAGRLLVELDAAELAQLLLREGSADRATFDGLLAEVVQRSMSADRGLRAYGEIVGLLTAQGELGAALALERYWDDLQRRLGFPLLCAYLLPDGEDADVVGRVCAGHTHLATH